MARGVAPLLPGQFGPAVAGGRRRYHGHLNWRRIFVALSGFTLIVAITAGGSVGALLWYGQSRLNRVEVPALTRPGDLDGDGDVEVREITDIRNVLIVGSDSREELGRAERDELGVGRFEGVRTDTLILVQLDPRRDAAAILSFPRDLLVERCDGTEGRINGAYQIGLDNKTGGPSCLVQTVTKLTDIPIHHYVEVDFRGFVSFIDRLGGVRMYLDEPIVDESANVDLPAGCQTLDGREALGFVRVRKIDSDFGRIARQQRFIREVVDQLTSARVALDVPRLFRLVAAGASAVKTDHSLSLGVMRRIAFSFRGLSADRIDARTVPAFEREINGAAYVVTDEEEAKPLFAAFAKGVAAPRQLGMKGVKKVTVGDVPPIVVLNGSGREGVATQVTRGVSELGYEVAQADNAPQKVATSVVLHPRGRAEEARLVAGALGIPAVRRDVDARDVTALLGSDFTPTRLQQLVERKASEGPPEPPEGPEPDFAGARETQKRC